jgi:hypothetical protein
MALGDVFESEVGIAVVATAAIMSPRARRVVRRAGVYGLAGVLRAGDAVAAAGRNVAHGAERIGSEATNGSEATGQAKGGRRKPAESPAP